MSQNASSESPLYYDPYDAAIDNDPYPVWKRMRDEAPLYYNEKHDFYALTRWDDVEAALLDWDTYRSGRGTILEVIRAKIDFPPGIILWEDPPIHDLHKNLLTKVFTPARMQAIEPLVRGYCARALDKLVGKPEFDVIKDLGVLVPMRTIGYLLGIPEADQESIRQYTDNKLTLEGGFPKDFDERTINEKNALVADYIEWRSKNPSNDLMTELLHAEVEEDGKRRRLTRPEVLTYTNVIAGAGAETATRLIGFTAQLLAEHPEQRRLVQNDASLIAPTIEEVLRYEAPSPVQCRYTSKAVQIYGQTIPESRRKAF
jgi:cytochrome P450